MAITLESLKLILKDNPKISFDGFAITLLYRLNIKPPYFSTENPNHASTVVSNNGMILALQLSRTDEPTDERIMNDILAMPDSLILGVKISDNGSIAMVRKLTVEHSTATAMQPTIKLKLHTNSLGLPSLYFDQIEALRALNADNEDQWIADKLKTDNFHQLDIYHYILEPRADLGLTKPLYQLHSAVDNVSSTQRVRMLVSKDKLKLLFPYLPVDDEQALSLLTRRHCYDKYPGLEFFEFHLKIETLFSLYGGMNRGGTDYTACLKQMLSK